VPTEVPSAESPKTIALIGATSVAEQIASRALNAGHRVIVDDVSDARLQAISAKLQAVHSSLTLTQSIESAIRSADFLIDALPDDLEVKLELFTLFDKFAKPDAIFITTGSIPIDDLAGITFCPDRCLAVSLTNAPGACDITFELIAAQQTSQETITASFQLFARICGLGSR
jgi:3-hydroxybutyryl-CoA dehydrogenase